MKKLVFILFLASLAFAASVESQVNFMLKSGETATYQNVTVPTTGQQYTLVKINTVASLIFDSNGELINDSAVINQVLLVTNAGSSISGTIDQLLGNMSIYNSSYQKTARCFVETCDMSRACLSVVKSPVYMTLLVMYGPPVRFAGENVTYLGGVIDEEIVDVMTVAKRINNTADGAPYVGLDLDADVILGDLRTINASQKGYIGNCSFFIYGPGATQQIVINSTHLNNSFALVNTLKSVSSSSASTGVQLLNKTAEKKEFARVKTLILEAETQLNATKQLTSAVLANVQVKRVVNLTQAADNKLSQIQSILPTNVSGAEIMLADLTSLVQNLNYTAAQILAPASELNKFIIALKDANVALGNATKTFGDVDDRLTPIKKRLQELDTLRVAMQLKVENYENIATEDITELKNETVNITSNLKIMKPKEAELDPIVLGGVFLFVLMIVGVVVLKMRKKAPTM